MPIPRDFYLEQAVSSPTTVRATVAAKSVIGLSVSITRILETSILQIATQFEPTLNKLKQRLISELNRNKILLTELSKQDSSRQEVLVNDVYAKLNFAISSGTKWKLRLTPDDLREVLRLNTKPVDVSILFKGDTLSRYEGSPIGVSADAGLEKYMGQKFIAQACNQFFYGTLVREDQGKFSIIAPAATEDANSFETKFLLRDGDVLYAVPNEVSNSTLRDAMLQQHRCKFDENQDAEFINGKLVDGMPLDEFDSYIVICLRNDANKKAACNEVWNEDLPVHVEPSFDDSSDRSAGSRGFHMRDRHFVFKKVSVDDYQDLRRLRLASGLFRQSHY